MTWLERRIARIVLDSDIRGAADAPMRHLSS
jgi:hypothetical protein